MLSFLWLPLIAYFLIWGCNIGVSVQLSDESLTGFDRVITVFFALLVISVGLGLFAVVFG